MGYERVRERERELRENGLRESKRERERASSEKMGYERVRERERAQRKWATRE